MNLRMILRSLICALCIFAAACCLPGEQALRFAVPVSLAEEDARSQLEIRITARPEEMVAPGDVMLSFTIENVSDEPAPNVYLSSADGLLSEPVGQLAAGESQSFNRQHSVTPEELENGVISYIISHDDPDDPNGKINYTAHAAIRRSDVQPRVEFTRRFSTLNVEENGALTITYRIRNTGNVALQDLRVQDSLGDYTGKVETLDVGQSRTLISRAVITEEEISSAVLDYYAAGNPDERFTQALADQTISIAESGLSAHLSAAPSPFAQGSCDLVLTLENTGDADIRDITITDESYGGVIADSLLVPAGQRIEFSYSCALRGDMQFTWKISGVSDSGKTITLRADAGVSQLPAGEEQPLRLSVSTDTPRIRRSGNVDLNVVISNPGGTDVRAIALTEEAAGLMRSFQVIPAGGSIERSFRFEVKENASFAFSLEYTAGNGETQRISAAPVEIVIAPDGVLPEGARNTLIEFTGTSIKIGGSSIYAALLISGLAVLLVLIVLLLIASRRARIEKQLRIAAEKQRRREEMGKTNRFTPVRAPKNKSKGR